jgi:DNA-binding NarL/FixJ family response regulator
VRAQAGWTVIGEMAPGALLHASGSGPISDRTDPPDVVLADLDGSEDSDAIDAWLGALQRDATGEELVAAIAAVAGGLLTLDRRLAGALLATPERLQAPTPERLADTEEPLTARELEVLQLLAEGLPNKLIAAQLHISEHTAKFHVSAIILKLGAASRTEAVTLAARRGLLIL